VGQLGWAEARKLLEASFAQFQADRGVAGLLAQIRRNDETLRQHEQQMACHLGDFTEYADLRRRLSERESLLASEGARERRGAVAASLETLRRGDVIRVPRGKRAGLAVVLDAGVSAVDDPRPLVVTEGRWSGRLTLGDFPAAVDVLGTVRVPKHVNHRSPQDRRDLASSVRALDLPDDAGRPRRARRGSTADEDVELVRLRRELRAHPCHQCADREQHARWGERYTRLARENDALRSRIEGRTGSLGRDFDRICRLLDDRGYLDADEATPAGRALARIWSESDLVAAECLRAGAWDGLDAAELAAVVSTLVYEPRRDEPLVDQLPTPGVRDALAATVRVWADLADDENQRGLRTSREPQAGFAWAAYRWARQEKLDRVLAAANRHGTQLSAGDFIRWCKQVLDLLDQLAAAPGPSGGRSPVAATARAAVNAIRHGVVAQSMGP
ncbi:MAG: RNA helicase, partial [Jatrophihabitans endophyticus]|nr:RNA helicase [Jatrophihabitans endophyticus]